VTILGKSAIKKGKNEEVPKVIYQESHLGKIRGSKL
jgi:hypothetical protein